METTPASKPAQQDFIWKNRSRREHFKLIVDIVGTAGILLTALSLILAIKAFRWQQGTRDDDYNWKRKDLALALVRDWDKETADHRQEIAVLLDRIQGPGGADAIVSEKTAAMLLNLNTKPVKPREEDFWALRKHLVSLGNYLDSVGVAVLSGAADKDIIAASLASSIRRFRQQTLAFANSADRLYNSPTWPSLYKLVGTWEEEERSKRSRK